MPEFHSYGIILKLDLWEELPPNWLASHLVSKIHKPFENTRVLLRPYSASEKQLSILYFSKTYVDLQHIYMYLYKGRWIHGNAFSLVFCVVVNRTVLLQLFYKSRRLESFIQKLKGKSSSKYEIQVTPIFALVWGNVKVTASN